MSWLEKYPTIQAFLQRPDDELLDVSQEPGGSGEAWSDRCTVYLVVHEPAQGTEGGSDTAVPAAAQGEEHSPCP